jgi:hypothetical protein
VDRVRRLTNLHQEILHWFRASSESDGPEFIDISNSPFPAGHLVNCLLSVPIIGVVGSFGISKHVSSPQVAMTLRKMSEKCLQLLQIDSEDETEGI